MGGVGWSLLCSAATCALSRAAVVFVGVEARLPEVPNRYEPGVNPEETTQQPRYSVRLRHAEL